ncbi:MAG: hypothetical protein HQ546_04750, partial [Planctomycetes bacterium]|nr:hypothetical protein [Planctomycetota bacterium]
MKNASVYTTKLKKLLSGLVKRFSPTPSPESLEPMSVMMLGILRNNAGLTEAMSCLELIDQEFVDFNELRVAPPKDIVDMLEGVIANPRDKAQRLTLVLHQLYDHHNTLDLQHMAEMGQRERHSHLRDDLGLDGFAVAYMMLYLFDSPSIPVDERMVAKLKCDELIAPDASIDDVQKLLNRIVPAKDRARVFECLSLYATEPMEPKPKALAADGAGAKGRTAARAAAGVAGAKKKKKKKAQPGKARAKKA